MKKLISLILAFALTFSCLSTVGFAIDDDEVRPAAIAKVIDPIISNADTDFCDSINNISYNSTNALVGRPGFTDMDAFIEDNAEDSMFGMSIDSLYNNPQEAFAWSNFRIAMVSTADHSDKSVCSAKQLYDACATNLASNRIKYEGKDQDQALFEKIYEVEFAKENPDTGRQELHYNYYFILDKGELSLVRANTNLYLKRIISNYWGGGKFFTDENAIKIINFIGCLFNPKFTLFPADFDPFDDNVAVDAYEFWGKVVELSNLDSLLQANWCNQGGINALPLMAALGVEIDSLLSGEKTNGYFMGRRILTDMFSEFCSSPLTYVMNLIWCFARGYSNSYEEPFRALFKMKINETDWIEEDEDGMHSTFVEESLSTVTGAFNFISMAVDSVLNKTKGEGEAYGFRLPEMPVKRLALAKDHDELFLLLLCYMNIARVYEDNEAVLKRAYSDFAVAVKDTYTKKELTTVTQFYDYFLLGKMTMENFLYDMLIDVTDTNVSKIDNDLFNSFKTSIVNLIKKIVDAIDNFVRILLGEKDPFERI